MAAAARDAGVPVVTGDTKVVERGKGDGVFITTTGVGVVPDGVDIGGDRARPGDAIIVSGTLGDHGVAIMSVRENLSFATSILSDTAALHGLVAAMVATVPGIRCLRDPTRGGLATTLNEIARQSGCGMAIRERDLPIRTEVNAACEFLGLDPLYVANEGKLVAIVAAADAAPLLAGDARASAGTRRRRHRRGDRGSAPLRPDGHDVRRPAQRRLAHRRAAAADLLTMRILFLAHAFNSLTQRLFVELRRSRPRRVDRARRQRPRHSREAVALHRPDLIVAPFLKRAIPEAIWRNHRCIVIHPGIRGDRGPSALDWAIMDGEREWGVTALQANGEMDAGDIWASVEFPMREATKASLYRNEVTEAAVQALRLTLERMAEPGYRPEPQPLQAPAPAAGCGRPCAKPTGRSTGQRTTRRRCCGAIRAADGAPGVLDEIAGIRVLPLRRASRGPAARRRRRPSIARRDGAICRATIDGAVWITHAKRAGAVAAH